VNDIGGAASHFAQHLCHDIGKVDVIDADQIMGDGGRIGQGAKDVKDGTCGNLTARADSMAHGRVVGGCKEKDKADFFDTGLGLFCAELQGDTEGFKHIGAAGALVGTVAMFGDFDASPGNDKGGDGTDIKFISSIAAGANQVKERRVANVGAHLDGVAAHGGGAARDLGNGFAFHAQAR
jgi:hypothetical protein